MNEDIKLELVKFGSPSLKKAPDIFNFDDYNAEALCKSMLKKQLELKGAGLSANQVGINARVFTMGDGKELTRYIINPEIIDIATECVTMREGCLSLPGIWLNLTRPIWVTARYQKTDGSWTTEKFTHVAARVFLHEYDHMLGQNFTERASKLKLNMALKKAEKRAKKYVKSKR